MVSIIVASSLWLVIRPSEDIWLFPLTVRFTD